MATERNSCVDRAAVHHSGYNKWWIRPPTGRLCQPNSGRYIQCYCWPHVDHIRPCCHTIPEEADRKRKQRRLPRDRVQNVYEGSTLTYQNPRPTLHMRDEDGRGGDQTEGGICDRPLHRLSEYVDFGLKIDLVNIHFHNISNATNVSNTAILELLVHWVFKSRIFPSWPP